MTEKEIIAGCKKNDRRCQSALYEAYYPLMKNVVSRYEFQEDDKSRLINSGFYKVLKNITKYNKKYSLATWIRNVVINNCIDEFRKSQRRIWDVHMEDLQEVPVEVEYNDGLRHLEQRDLLLILNELPAMAKTVFNLYAIDGFSHNEIGEMLNINPSTSRWHLNSARKRLQEILVLKANEEKKTIELAK